MAILAMQSPPKSTSSNGTACSTESRHPDHGTQLLHVFFHMLHSGRVTLDDIGIIVRWKKFSFESHLQNHDKQTEP